MRATLIHNPTAGDARPTAEDLEQILSESGFQVRYQSSKKNWKKALQRSTDLVVVAGGDGTVSKVLKHLAGSDQPIAILPVGTANNIGRTLGINGDARAIVARWKRARPRPIDIGVVTVGRRERRFVEGVGGGIFAAAIGTGDTAVGQAETIVGNELDRAVVHLRKVIADSSPERWGVDIDGSDHSGEYLAVEAMNIRFAGPSVPVAPRANPGDGLLDVVLVTERGRQSLLDYLDRRLAQKEVQLPRLKVRRGRRVTLHTVGDHLRVDDYLVESKSKTWHIELVPGAARVVWRSTR